MTGAELESLYLGAAGLGFFVGAIGGLVGSWLFVAHAMGLRRRQQRQR